MRFPCRGVCRAAAGAPAEKVVREGFCIGCERQPEITAVSPRYSLQRRPCFPQVRSQAGVSHCHVSYFAMLVIMTLINHKILSTNNYRQKKERTRVTIIDFPGARLCERCINIFGKASARQAFLSPLYWRQETSISSVSGKSQDWQVVELELESRFIWF